MARQNKFKKRGVYGKDLPKELAFLEQSVNEKFKNDDAVEYGPFDIIGAQTASQNARPWQVIKFDPTSQAGTVLLPNATAPDVSDTWIAVKNDSDSANAIVISSLGGLIDGQTTYTLQTPRGLQWFFSDGQNWHTASGTSTASAGIGIGTVAIPGVLRSIVGGAGRPIINIGGFWTLQDSGGGWFYWNASDTRADDQGTIIRPTAIAPGSPGRWNRIYSGPLQVDWFGAYGDSSRGTTVDGHDDLSAIQTAVNVAASYGHRLLFDPKKCYRIAANSGNGLDLSQSQGLVLDGQGSFTFVHGAWLKFTGFFRDTCIRAYSVLGLQIRGLVLYGGPAFFDNTTVDFTYANAAARLASVHASGDLGKRAKDTDTGLITQLAQTPSVWLQSPFCIIDYRRKNWGGIKDDYTGGTATEGSDSSACVIASSLIAGSTVDSMRQGIRMSDVTNMTCCDGTQITNVLYGITGVDEDFGHGFSAVVKISTCVFNGIKAGGYAIYQPFANWTMELNTLEGKTDNTICGIARTSTSGGASTNLIFSNNSWEDSGSAGGYCISLVGCEGVIIQGNLGYNIAAASGFCYLAGCSGVQSSGNAIFQTSGYTIEPTGQPCFDMVLGPDRGTIAVTGSNYLNSAILWTNGSANAGGFAWGPGHTFPSGVNGAAFGTGNTVGASAVAIGANNVASGAGSLVSGVSGTSSDNSERVLGGGTTVNGSAAHMRENVLGKLVPNTNTATSLLNASQAGQGITLTNGRVMYIIANVSSLNGSTNLRVVNQIWAFVKKTGGTATIIEQGVNAGASHDTGVTGITAAFTITSNNLDIQVTVPVAVGGSVMCESEHRALTMGYV